jgi:hypothetical protein
MGERAWERHDPPSAARLNYVERDVQVHAGWTESGTPEQLIANACGSRSATLCCSQRESFGAGSDLAGTASSECACQTGDHGEQPR